jgi:hypothetical protein
MASILNVNEQFMMNMILKLSGLYNIGVPNTNNTSEIFSTKIARFFSKKDIKYKILVDLI